MELLKKQSVGFFITILSGIVMLAGIILYFINCNTNYFSNLGINMAVVVCGVVGIVGQITYVALNEKEEVPVAAEILPIVNSALFMFATVTFIGSRVYGLASIITFENNAANMADLTNAITGMAVCLAAVILAIISSFFNVKKVTA